MKLFARAYRYVESGVFSARQKKKKIIVKRMQLASQMRESEGGNS